MSKWDVVVAKVKIHGCRVDKLGGFQWTVVVLYLVLGLWLLLNKKQIQQRQNPERKDILHLATLRQKNIKLSAIDDLHEEELGRAKRAFELSGNYIFHLFYILSPSFI